MVALHVHTTVALAVDPGQALDRLTADLSSLASEATATAIAAGAPLTRTAGFRATALPSVTAREAAADEVAAAVVTWSGDEEATGWPSMELRLVVTPSPGGGSRLGILSPRMPGHALTTSRVDKTWRDRLARTAVHGFAAALAEALAVPGGVPAADSESALR